MRGHAFLPCALLIGLFHLSRLPAAADTFVADVIGKKNCDQTELSPDGHWLAVTRTYSQPKHGQIWQDADASTRLVIWSCAGNELDGFIEWEDSSIRMVKIAWSPDSRFLVLLCTAANGLRPWAFPTLVFDSQDETLHNTTPLGTIVSDKFNFVAPHTLHIETGTGGAPQPLDFDLGRHIADLPVLARLKPATGP